MLDHCLKQNSKKLKFRKGQFFFFFSQWKKSCCPDHSNLSCSFAGKYMSENQSRGKTARAFRGIFNERGISSEEEREDRSLR